MTYLKKYDESQFNEFNFHKVARMQFQILAQLCKISKKMVNTSLSIFRDTDFITADVISHVEFNIRVKSIIEQLKMTTATEFMNVLRLIQVVNHGNQLATLRSLNWKFLRKYPAALDEILTLPQTYGAENCSCGIQSNCSQSYNFHFPIPNQPPIQIPTGFRFGCMALDSVLQSSLICLYNKTCLTFMQTSMYYSKPTSAEILTYSPLFPPNTTIETIVSQLFVSEWFENVSFDLYFNECAPQSCQYSYSMQYNPIYVATTLMGLFGGLTEGLRVFLYFIEFLIIKFIDRRKKKNQVAPDSHPQDIHVSDLDNNTIEIGSVSATVTIQVTISYYYLIAKNPIFHENFFSIVESLLRKSL
jgi:hypothetical protein